MALVLLAVSGPVAESIGDVLGVGDTAVQVWNIAKWPVLALVAVLIIALLYYSTPNVKQPQVPLDLGRAPPWPSSSASSPPSASPTTSSNFGSYNKTYGSLAGVVVALLFLWIINLALLFGAELDSELERGRQLQAGMPAEEELQLPARDTRNIEKAAEEGGQGRRPRPPDPRAVRRGLAAAGRRPTNAVDTETDDTERDQSSAETNGKHKEKS